MIISVSGSDTYRAKAHVDVLVEEFKKKRDQTGLNVVQIDCVSLKQPGVLLEEIRTVPFLAEKKLVVVKNIFVTKDAKILELVFDAVKNNEVPDSTVVVFFDEDPKPRKKIAKEFLKYLQALPYSQRFDSLTGQDLRAWIVQEVADCGGQISNAAVTQLMSMVKTDLWGVHNIIEQLVAFANSSLIDTETVRLFVPEPIDDNVFNLVDAILNGRKQVAYTLIRGQYAAGEDANYIFAMLLRQCRILMMVRDALRAGYPQTNLAKVLQLHPFVVKKTTSQVRNFDVDRLTRLYTQLLNFDQKVKTTGSDSKMLLDMLVSNCAI